MLKKKIVVFLMVISILSKAAIAGVATVPLYSPADFLYPVTTIDFDDASHEDPAYTLYSGLGVEFSRDDAGEILIIDSGEFTLNTTSPPNVLASFNPSDEEPPRNEYVPHLNVILSSPATEIGAYFGYDPEQTFLPEMVLSVYDESHTFIGSVPVQPNANFDVDQFIGLRSDVPFLYARFEQANIELPIVIDDLSFSSPTIVPVPSAMLLGGFGIACVTWLRKRKAL